ncbi:MAG: multidrug transporter [Patescibacteria group bacterium]|nr:multidrug transporter [Patescibacteria group bacterium]
MGVVEAFAGLGYLLQKVFLLIAEGDESVCGRRWRISGWIAYLIGLPMWMVIFFIESDLILIFVEGGGAPSMVLGLIIALRGSGKEPEWLNTFAIVMTFVGIGVSLYVFGGLVTLTQALELGVAIGFLVGTYLLARKNPTGWPWYLLMNGSAGTLMWMQEYPLLALQQAFSFIIVIAAYGKSLKAN